MTGGAVGAKVNPRHLCRGPRGEDDFMKFTHRNNGAFERRYIEHMPRAPVYIPNNKKAGDRDSGSLAV